MTFNKRHHSDKTKELLRISMIEQYRSGKRIPYQLGKPQLMRRGKKASNWQGGITSWDQTERTRVEFKVWHREVFKLNKNQCICCGEKKLSLLVAHHKKHFKDFPLLKYAVKNGVIVCRSCHPSVHRYGLEYIISIGGSKISKQCLFCKMRFIVPLHRKDSASYCSRNCHYSSRGYL